MLKQITVLMPTRNSARFISESLTSVEKDLCIYEILVLDSSSTDGTQEIVKKHPKARVLDCGEMGISDALNSAITQINTKYVARMDADDVSQRDRFTLQLKFLIDGDYDLVGSDITYFGGHGWYLNYIKRRHFTFTDLDVMFFFKSPIVHPTWLMKTELMHTIRYRNQMAEDYDFLVRARMFGAKLGILNEELLYYRLSNNQSSKAKRAVMLEASNEISNSYIDWFSSNSYVNLDVAVKDTLFRASYSSVKQLIRDFEVVCSQYGNLLSKQHLKEIFFRMLFRLTECGFSIEIFRFMLNKFGAAFAIDSLPLLIRARK